MTQEQSINHTIEWLVFNREVGPTGTVYDGSAIAGDYRATQKVPPYTSDIRAAQLVIEHFEKDGATITFTEESGLWWKCDFEPPPGDVYLTSTATKQKTRPRALCLCILKSASEFLAQMRRMPVSVAELLEKTKWGG